MTRFAPTVLLATLLVLSAPAASAAPAADAGLEAAVAAASALLEARSPTAGAAVGRLRKAHPDDPSVGVLQVRWLLQQGEREDALDLAEDLAEAAPRHAQAQYWLGNAYGQRIGEVGMLTQARYAPKLRAAFERALALDPSLHEARLSLVEYHLQAPAIVGGDPAVAKAQQRELARRDPPRGLYAAARIAAAEGKDDVAARGYVAAWQARPASKGFRMSAGLALQGLGRWDEAHALFTAWLREEPAHAPSLYQLGRIAALSGKFLDEGASGLRRYLERAPEAGQPKAEHAWWRLAQIQKHAGDVAAARASLQRALKLAPGMEEAEAELATL